VKLSVQYHAEQINVSFRRISPNQKSFLHGSSARIAGAPSKRKKMKEKCSEGLSYACSLSARIVTRLYDADRLLQNDRATTHQNMWLGECGFCIALYVISPPSHFGNASLPH